MIRQRLCVMVALSLGALSCSFFDPVSQGGYSVTARPLDTALLVGNAFQVRAIMKNSFGDTYPSSHIDFHSQDSSVVVSGRTVMAVKLGRASIIASRDDLRDTVYVSVVPTGMLGVVDRDSAKVRIMRTDGAGAISVAPGTRVAWLPGGAGLVYQSGTNAVMLDDLNGSTRQLAANGTEMRASQDGQWVYYTVLGSGIWRVHLDGSGTEQVTGATDGDPEPSPDGAHLVFRRRHFPDDGLFQIELRDLATGSEQELAHYGLRPRWSPDGSSIAFVYSAPGLPQDLSITVMNADGTGIHQVSPAGAQFSTDNLDWSPDGKWLVVRGPGSLQILNVSTGLILPLGYATSLTWVAWQR